MHCDLDAPPPPRHTDMGNNLQMPPRWIVLAEEPRYEINQFGFVRHRATLRPKKFRLVGKGIGYVYMIVDGRSGTGRSWQGGRRRRYRVHRLVAKYFIPNPNKYPDINHLDGDKHNNFFENLEWTTWDRNNDHARALGIGGCNK